MTEEQLRKLIAVVETWYEGHSGPGNLAFALEHHLREALYHLQMAYEVRFDPKPEPQKDPELENAATELLERF